jgi:uncharacterized repeat protein (TIGR02543 family)
MRLTHRVFYLFLGLTLLIGGLPTPMVDKVSAIEAVLYATQIQTGGNHSLALMSNKTVRAWGRNSDGQLGNGTTINKYTSVKVSGLSNIRAVAAGEYHSLALKEDGTVWGWGRNNDGQLGNGGGSDQLTPVQITINSGHPSQAAVAISTRYTHSLILMEDGTVWALGDNADGQLGNGSTAKQTQAVQVSTESNAPLQNIVSVSAGDYHSLALDEDGAIWAWGYNGGGELGQGSHDEDFIPKAVKVKDNQVKFIEISAGSSHSLALQEDGTVWAWGENEAGQLGDVTEFNKKSAVQTTVTDAVYIAAGGQFSLALKNDKTVWGWGSNGVGELGDGTFIARALPVKTQINDVVAIAAGENHALAVKEDGTVWSWGFNLRGQLGNGDFLTKSSPVQVFTAVDSPLEDITALAAGDSHSLALKRDGTIWAWGDNQRGQVGNTGDAYTQHYAVQVQLTDVIAIAAGEYYSLALQSNGSVWAWGANTNLQLGDGTTTNTSTPVQVIDNGDSTGYLTEITTIAARMNNSLAIKNDENSRSVWLWGNQQALSAIHSLPDITAIAAGDNHQLALSSDGSVWSWGNNPYGQLGIGTTIDATVPTEVVGMSQVVALAAGTSHSMALRSDRTVWTWGYGYNGQLGEGTLHYRVAPVPIMLAPSPDELMTSSDATLRSLILSSISLQPVFDSNTTAYTASVPYHVTSALVSAEANHPEASIQSDQLGSKQLEVGDNIVEVHVTAEDGSQSTYTVTVRRADLKNASEGPIPVADHPVTIVVPESATSPSFTIAPTTVAAHKKAILPLIEVQATTSLGEVKLAIPPGTTITGPLDWDGTIQLPQVQSNDSVTLSEGNVNAVIEVGLPDGQLTFDRAVRLLMPGQGGRAAGYVRSGVFTKISGTISADTQEAADHEIAVGGDAVIRVGNDLVIWTKHFTAFISYTPSGGDNQDLNIFYVNSNSGNDNYAGTSWDTAFATLQKALDAADTSDGDTYEIWMAAGTYYPTANMTGSDAQTRHFQMKNGVTIYGGFPTNADQHTSWEDRDWSLHETNLSGAVTLFNVFKHDGLNLDETAILDGVTISDGYSTSAYGGGMYNRSSSPTLNNVTFRNNHAFFGGGMENNDSSPTLNNVIFHNNYAEYGGGMSNENSHPVLTNVTFTDNQAHPSYGMGGGMYNIGSNPTLVEVTFIGNEAYYQGSGMHNYQSHPSLSQVLFQDHDGIGMYNNSSDPTLTDVEFIENSTGITNENGSDPRLINVRISGNSGSGMVNKRSNPTLINVLLSGQHTGMYNETYSEPTLINVTVSGNDIGINNRNHSSSSLKNSIVWGNQFDIVNENAESSTAIINSLVGTADRHGPSGIDLTTLTAADLFIDPRTYNNVSTVAGSYELTRGSPALERGIDVFMPVEVVTDLAGNPRRGGVLDLGAYEKCIVKENICNIVLQSDEAAISYTPYFVFTNFGYSAFVTSERSSVTVTPVVDFTDLSVQARVNNGSYTVLDDTNPSVTFALNYGDNIIEVSATNSMGVEQLYTYSVYRGYFVSYHSNGHTGGAVPIDAASYRQGDPVTALANTSLIRPGYTFAHWVYERSGTEFIVEERAEFTMGSENVSLQAVWTANTYQVSFDTDGGTMDPVTQFKQYDATYGKGADGVVAEEMPVPAKTGYSFDGWYTGAGGAGALVTNATAVTRAEDHILYANWIRIPPPTDDNDGEHSVISSTHVDVLVNGKVERAGIAIQTEVDGQKVTTITVDKEKLNERLVLEGEGVVLTIPVSGDSHVVIGELDGEMIKNMEHKQAIIEIRTDRATYTLPALQINIDAISQQLGRPIDLAEIKMRIEISEPSVETLSIVKDAAYYGGFSLVMPPLNFSVKGVYDNKTYEVTSFNEYVERTFAIPDEVDANKITTGVVIEPDGTYRHVPTQINLIDGRYYAKVNSLTNSTYALVWNPKSFQDAAFHWAKEAVNDMGSRLIVSGVGDDTFKPGQDITRAEFAAIIVRGLGLKLETGTTIFNDVNDSDWYSKSIRTAYSHNLISGFEDGSFRPVNKITREQVMVMIARAMEITGLNVKLQAFDTDRTLQPFADANQVSDWAKGRWAEVLQAALVYGRSSTQLAPQQFITRAEAAVIIRRLLQGSELI